jgi:hypothetical protein
MIILRKILCQRQLHNIPRPIDLSTQFLQHTSAVSKKYFWRKQTLG